MRKMARNVPKMAVFQREPARPPAGIPAYLGDLHRLHWVRFRVILGATLLPDECPVGVRRQLWSGQGGLKPPWIVTLL